MRRHATQDGWHGRLAALGAGTETAEQVLAAASDAGERCEAHFYAGAQRLGVGDREGAERAFRAALETGMANFYEYRRAIEHLALP